MEYNPPRRIIRTAAKLSVTPVEIVESVLADLPLHRVLDLLTTSYGQSTDSALRAALKTSVAWKVLRDVDLHRVSVLWKAFNQMSYLLQGTRVMGTHLQPRHVHLPSSGLALMSSLKFQSNFEAELESEFFFHVLMDPRFPVRSTTTLKGILLHLPVPNISSTYFDNWGNLRAKGLADAEDAMVFLPQLCEGRRLLIEARSSELHRLANLYDRFPTYLKTSLAPQTPRRNPRHIPRVLRSYAKRPDYYRHCFRFSHPALVPYDWCYQLFDAVAPQVSGDLEDGFHADLQKSIDGMKGVYTSSGPEDRPKRRSPSDGRDGTASGRPIQIHCEQDHFLPSHPDELDWLESFMRCIKRMEAEFPELAVDLKVSASKRALEESCKTARPELPWKGVLLEQSDFVNYIEKSPSNVAAQLRADFESSKKDTLQLPSLLALYMPPFSSPRGRRIAAALWPSAHLDNSVRQLLYEEMIDTIKKKIQNPPEAAAPDGQGEAQKYKPSGAANRQRTCYICNISLDEPHKTLSSMCVPCGDFNLAERALSLPENLSLEGKTALVTGGRINLGFHTALRLLRCGAFVIVSSRYPEDALSRYQKELDFNMWADRLRIIGADFRTSMDAFALVNATKTVLLEGQRTLDILINNAAQTLTDSVEKEQRAIGREQKLLGTPTDVVIRHGYTARVRGGATSNSQQIAGGGNGLIAGASPTETPSGEDQSLAMSMTDLQVAEHQRPSSWVQSLSDIPYEDVITAHSVNTFVPLILIREMLPAMSPGGHIVNVSSREGIFEQIRDSGAKNGKHVHTNMSKAGLNMITETEAASAWKQRKVAINTVDPGYMSAAPEFELAYGGERPIGWEDGAGRVLWPIAKSQKGEAFTLWGRFLKHYGAARISTRGGRG